jgi:bifunctional enzyme CysN/CysC
MQRPLNVVAVGEVDSGKSTLIGRFLYETGSLLGDKRREKDFSRLLDSLEEERRDYMTIETTQAFCRSPGRPGFMLIDVPGHLELIANMISGTSYADAAVLVVDAGRPAAGQAREHLSVLRFLGIVKTVIAVNKMDCVDFSLSKYEEIKAETGVYLAGAGLQCRWVVPVSALHGDNLLTNSARMPWYEGPPLSAALDSCRFYSGNGSFRLCVQDLYDVRGETVAAGRVVSGRITLGEQAAVLPQGRVVRVKKILEGFHRRTSAGPGKNIGVVLDDMRDIRRGHCICKEPYPQANRSFRSRLLFTGRANRKGEYPPDPGENFCLSQLNRGLRLCCLTQDTSACITEFRRDDGGASGERIGGQITADAVILTADPVVLEKSDACGDGLARFVLKDENGSVAAVGYIPAGDKLC